MSHVQRNPRVAAHQVEPGVWGLYNLDSGKNLFVDEFSHALMEVAESVDGREAVLAACRSALDTASAALDSEVGRRLDELHTFGALVPVAPPRMPDVLLIDAPYEASQASRTGGAANGLCYLSAALQAAGRPAATLLDMRRMSPVVGNSLAAQARYFAEYAPRCNPAVVGITAVSATIDEAVAMARLSRAVFPGAFVVLGGPHPSYRWEELLAAHAFIDAVILGEGELPFPQLVARVIDGGERRLLDFHDVPGVAWRQSGGQPISSGWCSGVSDLDTLPIPDCYHGFLNAADLENDHPRVMTSRGCPFKCSFCSTATFTGRRTRYRSSAHLMRELELYWRTYGQTRFDFSDDIFTVNRRRTIDVCRAILAAPFAGQIQWGCNTRMDCVDEELLDIMYEAGCRSILFGIESGDLDVQTRFGKGKRTLDHFGEKVRHMFAKGIDPHLNFILGLPGEDARSVGQIVTLIREFPQARCSLNFLTIFPGTPLEAQMQELGIRFLGDDNHSRYSLTAPTVDTPTMPADEQIRSYLGVQWARKRNIARAQTTPAAFPAAS